ncbi:hypothetical protein KUCAC02_013058, partial [Chaenocephalus aceratus]
SLSTSPLPQSAQPLATSQNTATPGRGSELREERTEHWLRLLTPRPRTRLK